MPKHILDHLYDILQDRKNADPEASYVASLYAKGTPKIAKKIGEEAAELIIEAIRLDAENKKSIRDDFKNETADLLFHILVLLSHHNIRPDEVFEILSGRVGVSGHEEKARRTK